MIFQLQYVVDGLKINGFIAIPNWIACRKTDIASALLSKYNFEQAKLKQISYSIIKQTEHIKDVQLPALLYCRGGIKNHGKVKMEWLEQFAAHGYIVFAPTYRGNEGSEGRDEFGGSDQNDSNEAFRLLASLPFVDRQQISIMGFSRGAINATQTAITMKNTKHLIVWGGVSHLADIYDVRIDLRRMLKRVVGTSPQKNMKLYEQRSPITMAEQIHCPTLIIHGSIDTHVPFSQAEKIFHELKAKQKQVTMHRYEGYAHHFPLPIHLFAIARMFSWMKLH